MKAPLIEEITATTEAERPGDYPLSEGQHMLFSVQLLSPDSSAHNLFTASRSKIRLQLPALARALHVMTERHSLLRSVFVNRREGPVRSVLPAHVIPYKVNFASDWDEQKLEDYLYESANQPFDLSQSPPFRVEAILRSKRGDVLLIVTHEIIADLWSVALLLEEIAAIYSTLCEGRVASLSPAVPAPYSAFVKRQLAGQSSGERVESARIYWKTFLKDPAPIFGLTIDHTSESTVGRGSSHWFRLDKSLSQLLRGLARASKVSLYALLLASFEAMLLQMYGQKYVLVNSPISCRDVASDARTVGHFVNEVVLRAWWEPSLTFADFIQTVQADVMGALANRNYPISSLFRDLWLKGELCRPSLAQVMFEFQKSEYMLGNEIASFILGHTGTRFHQGCLELEAIPVQRRGVQCELALMMTEDMNELFGVFHYDAGIFDRKSIEHMTQEFEILLAAIVRDSTCSLGDLPIQKRRL